MLAILTVHFIATCLLAAVPIAAIQHILKKTSLGDRPFIRPILSLGAFCLIAYGSFWVFFLGARLGLIYNAAIFASSSVVIFRARRRARDILCRESEPLFVFALTVGIGLLYLSILLIYSPPPNTDILPFCGQRFLPLPVDNALPVMFAKALERGQSTLHLFGSAPGDWLGSDRPPLQVGVIVSLRPLLGALGFLVRPSYFVVSLWAQLLWVPALWALLRTCGASIRQAAWVTATTSLTGFCLLHSLYTWPKLLAAALLLGGVSLLLANRRRLTPLHFGAASALFALGHLAHGGSDFALIAGLPLLALHRDLRPNLRSSIVAVTVFFVLCSPWAAYQKFYDPPGNRLAKWHLAGVTEPDPRSVSQLLVSQYQAAGITGTIQNKWANFSCLFAGRAKHFIELSPDRDAAFSRRNDEFFYFAHALGWGLVPLSIALYHLLRRRKQPSPPSDLSHNHRLCFLWSGLTLVVWCLLMFTPGSTIVHQGSLVLLLVVFALSAFVLLQHHPFLFAAFLAVQGLSFLATWLPPGPQAPSLNVTACIAVCLIPLLFISIIWLFNRWRSRGAESVSFTEKTASQ